MADPRVGEGMRVLGMLEAGVPGRGRGLDVEASGVRKVLARRRDLRWGFLK